MIPNWYTKEPVEKMAKEKVQVIHNKELKSPRVFSTKIFTSGRNILPYNRPDWNDTPADKESAHRFKYPAGETSISLRMPHQMSLFTKQYKYLGTPRKAS